MSLPVLPPVVEALPNGAAGPRNYDDNYIFFWNGIALDLVRLTHTIGGFQTGPPVTARFLGMMHLAMHDAYFGAYPYRSHASPAPAFVNDFEPYLEADVVQPQGTTGLPGSSADAKDAVAGAAITVLTKLFRNPAKRDASVSMKAAATLGDFVTSSVRSYQQAFRSNLHSPAYFFGVDIANTILDSFEIKAGEPGVDATGYLPIANQSYFFNDDPSHPIRPQAIDPNDPAAGIRATHPYHGPFYGKTASVGAVISVCPILFMSRAPAPRWPLSIEEAFSVWLAQSISFSELSDCTLQPVRHPDLWQVFATTTNIQIAAPPVVPKNPPPNPPKSADTAYLEYLDAVEDVHRMGGIEELATTKRRPAQTAGGLFWAYDGVGLIGTPPRLYNQIVKQIAFDRKSEPALDHEENNAEFIRLLTLINVAMADAGTYCWREKYTYELWRPLSGVRQDPTGPGPDGFGRPTWKVLGAPATNSNEGGFKPPFPAYPSGHATFGAAAFQMARLFYHQRGDLSFAAPSGSEQDDSQQPVQDETSGHDRNVCDDDFGFTFISDELNGISRTLYQPYQPSVPIQDQPGDVRTRLPTTFKSLKEAIFSNAISRIWLGVHWTFDAFSGKTVCEKFDPATGAGVDVNQPRPANYQQQFQVEADGSTKYKAVADMDWFAEEPLVGGVPLGMEIANSIFDNRMRKTGSVVDLGVNVGRRR